MIMSDETAARRNLFRCHKPALRRPAWIFAW